MIDWVKYGTQVWVGGWKAYDFHIVKLPVARGSWYMVFRVDKYQHPITSSIPFRQGEGFSRLKNAKEFAQLWAEGTLKELSTLLP